MGLSIKSLTKSISKVANSVADVFTYGGYSKLTKSDSYMNDLTKAITGKGYADTLANSAISAGLSKGTDLLNGENILSNIFGTLTNAITGSTNGLSSVLNNLVGGLGDSIFSAKQAKEQAKYNSELNYKYQTKLNEQGYAHDKEMLGLQQAYDREMANTAVQRQMADLQSAGVNPAMASQLGGAGGGGLGGGSSLGGGTAQTDKANWLAYNLEKMAGQRDAQRVAIEQANSAKSAEVANKQMEQMDANIAETIVRTGVLPRQADAEIKKSLAQAGKDYADTAKSKAETAKINEETNRILQGWLGQIAGTKHGENALKILGPAAAAIPGVGIGMKAYKGAKIAKGFGNFLKAVK